MNWKEVVNIFFGLSIYIVVFMAIAAWSEGEEMNLLTLKDIRSKFDSFIAQAKSDPTSGEDMLTEAYNEVEKALEGEITPELVHLADDIYTYMGKLGLEKRISLHRRYLKIVSDNKERFWSHWQLVDTLAVLQRNRETVEEQIRLYRWTCEHLSDAYVLEALYDTTQAKCWKEEGRIDAWFQLYEETSERLENPEVNRYTRCLFLQAGAEVSLFNDRLDEALLEVEKLERLNSAHGLERYFQFWLSVITARLLVYSKQEDWDRFNHVFMEASTFLEEEIEKRNTGHPVNIGNLRWAAHDIGWCLLWSKKYNEAQHFLQIAIDFGNDNAWSHFFLAVSIWASEKDREKTLYHLKTAQDFMLNPLNRDMFHQTFLETPEFSDVKDDKEFLKVLGQN
ncbi:hypothetical protein F4X10_14545 [Candidatus Poribacteria bacterium]|nr:hypothetical protein [Candidatus Poribacteria bacterium]